MRLKKTYSTPLKYLSILTLGLTLIACGGSSSNSRLTPPGDSGDAGAGGGNGGGGGGGGGNTQTYRMGNGAGTEFSAGEIAVGIGSNSLAPGGRTTLNVSVVDNEGNLLPNTLDVDFTSACIATGAATIEPSTSSNGRTQVDYIANGCVGDDVITASSAVSGIVVSASATVTVAADTAQAVQFIEAAPNFISLRGTGNEEVSEVLFRIVGATGAAMGNVDVEFTLNQGSGDATLIRETGISGPNGEVSAFVQSGYRAGTVRVTAHIPAEGFSTQSSQILVSTGIPVQGRTSISASELYPVSWGTDGVESSINIRMADQFANPAANGTAVYFTTNSGVIEPGCLIDDGACSVTWRSQDPRPHGTADYSINADGEVSCPSGEECRSGRVLILATAIGNETFIDMKQSGRYDHTLDIFNSNGDTCEFNQPVSSLEVANPTNSTIACDDLGEAYFDLNANGFRDNHEPVVDENGSTVQHSMRTEGNGIYDGILCGDESLAAEACSRNTVTIRAEARLIMTSPKAAIWDFPTPFSLSQGVTTITQFALSDINGNGMPAGTTISVNSILASNVTFSVFPPEVGASSEPAVIYLKAEGADDAAPSGKASIVVTSGSTTSTFTFDIE